MQGFQAQGNEFSYFMLLASAYLLNGVERAEQVGRREAGEGSVVRGTKHRASRSPACALHCFALVLPPVPQRVAYAGQPMLQWTIHPWCTASCNQPTVADQLRGVPIPDVYPAELVPAPGLLSMSAVGGRVGCRAWQGGQALCMMQQPDQLISSIAGCTFCRATLPRCTLVQSMQVCASPACLFACLVF